MLRKYYPFLFIALFLGMLVLPLRTLALDPQAIEESFYPRGRLITLVADLRLRLGDRVFPKVIVGDEGWLVYTAESDIEDYQKADLFTEEELARIQKGLDKLSARYAEQGITLVVVVPPNKNSIYPERVPAQVPVLGEQSKLEQLVEYLGQHGHTQLLDLRPALLAARAEREIYYATDTHWNDYGTYLAYAVLMAELQKTHPDLAPHPMSDFKVVTRAPEHLDLAENIGASLYEEARIQFSPQYESHTTYKNVTVGGRKLMFSYNPDSSLPRLALYHDSFFFRVIPLLGEHFSRGVYVQNYIAGGLWNLSWVDEQQPDVVVFEFSERYLKDLLLLIETGTK
ncbi:MAG: alginate O-acetyltransferase AlgX-related protein [Chloroflexota bacterium]